jgi:tetratricopeptide (TPR) repeat protein
MEWLHTALERARERFELREEYPLIDDDEIIDDGVVRTVWPWWEGARCTDELLRAALTSDHTDPPIRFVCLNLFYQLAHYAAEEVSSVVEEEDNALQYREQFLCDLKTLVGLVKEQVNDCRDARRIRWEIVNACAVQDWDWAKCLYVRLEELAEKDAVAHVLAARGRHEFLTVFADRWEMGDYGLWLWVPAAERDSSDSFTGILALRCLLDDSAGALCPDQENGLADAVHHLERALRGKLEFDLDCRFLLLRCRLALGKFREAVADCEALLKRREELAGAYGPEKGIRSRLYALAVEAYESDGQIDRAVTASERWVKEFPNEAGIHERRSRLFAKQGDLDSAYKSLRTEVDSNPRRGENLAVSMALRYGELYGAPEAQWNRFRRNVDPNETSLVRSLVCIHWPQAVGLADSDLKEWADACSVLLRHGPDNPSYPIVGFGKVAENELRSRVFDRFRQTLGTEDILSIRRGAERDPLTRYLLRGKFALGEMLNEIRHREARSAAGRRFREWLGREKNGWRLTNLPGADLVRLTYLDEVAKHQPETPLSWENAAEMARLSRELLNVVVEGW